MVGRRAAARCWGAPAVGGRAGRPGAGTGRSARPAARGLRQLAQVEADPLPSVLALLASTPRTGRLPKWLREAFGDTYSEDLIVSRMPTEEERQQPEIPPDTPVTIIKGTTRDGEHGTLHFTDKVTVARRMTYGYRFGVVPKS
jgi:hypothetical protein